MIAGVDLHLPPEERAKRGLGRLLLVGPCLPPELAGWPDLALSGQVGERLARLMGVSYARYMAGCDRTSAMPADRPGEWDAALARRRGPEILEAAAGRPVVLLGSRVAEVLDGSGRLFASPHPSGPNRWWMPPGAGGAPEADQRRTRAAWRGLGRLLRVPE